MIGLIVIILIGIIGYFAYLYYKGDSKTSDKDLLTTDMEIYIAQLEIKPQKNKLIKKVAKYLDSIIMPNEKVLAVAYSYLFTIITDKRIIIKGDRSNYTNIIPMEKVTSVTQNGTRLFINQNWINLLSVNLATEIMELINSQVSSTQTVKETIKIENKIVTEETITSQLQKLSDLHKAGILTDYEYSVKKQELLDKMK